MKIVDIVRAVSPRAYVNYLTAFETSEPAFKKYGITTNLRITHFLAQSLYETGLGTVLFEDMSYKTADRIMEIFGVGKHSAAIKPDEAPSLVRNPQALAERVYGLGNPKKARELGNTRPGDGYKYRGGGLLQTTGGKNYKRLGDAAGADFYGDPNLIVDPNFAIKPALLEWDENDLNAYADKNDIRTITFRINGGYNGFEGRQRLFDRIWNVVTKKDTPAWRGSAADDDVRSLQEALHDLGAEPPLLVDGRYGPATVEAVKWFQASAGLPVDGIAGEVTLAALPQRLNQTRGRADA